MHSLWKFRSFPWHLYFLDKTLLFFFLFVTNFFCFQTVFSHLCWQASSASLFLRYSWEWIYLLGLLSSFNHVKCISFIFSLAFCYSCYLAPWHTYKTLYTSLIIIYLLLILHSFQSLFFFFLFITGLFCIVPRIFTFLLTRFPLNSYFPPMPSKKFFLHVRNNIWKLPLLTSVFFASV